jgi:hypothetical protein
MVFWPPYPWYFDPPIHGILTPLPMLYWPPYPWYIDNPTHGILNPLLMVYRLSYAWYFDPPSHRISTPYTWYFDLPAYFFIINGGVQNTTGVQFTIQGGSVFNKGVQYTMDVNRSRVQFTMGFKIPYDTGIATVRIVRYIRNISE